jgi:aspartyl-tRNA(Asn)/glutamyl-tRNA(Gln) amidotransferase subunit C
MDLNVEYIAGLARIKLSGNEEEKFSGDLSKILDYFRELQEVNTENVKPMSGCTELKSVFRADDKKFGNCVSEQNLKDSFPDKENGFLKVPQIFSNED